MYCIRRRCVSPPGVGAGLTIRVVVGSLLSLPSVTWTYDAPTVASLYPAALSPLGGDVLLLTGTNFGAAPTAATAVTVAGRPCVPLPALWSHTQAACEAPPGVSATAAVQVTVASLSAFATASYAGPVVTGVEAALLATTGGDTVVVSGANFSVAAPMRVAVALVRSGPRATLPCVVTAFAPGNVTAQVPEGAGTGWRVVVSNVDPGVSAASAAPAPVSAASLPSEAAVAYRPPVVDTLEQLGAAFPAAGGFRLRINGSHLSRAPRVAVDGVPCAVDPAASQGMSRAGVLGPCVHRGQLWGGALRTRAWCRRCTPAVPLCARWLCVGAAPPPRAMSATPTMVPVPNFRGCERVCVRFVSPEVYCVCSPLCCTGLPRAPRLFLRGRAWW